MKRYKGFEGIGRDLPFSITAGLLHSRSHDVKNQDFFRVGVGSRWVDRGQGQGR